MSRRTPPKRRTHQASEPVLAACDRIDALTGRRTRREVDDAAIVRGNEVIAGVKISDKAAALMLWRDFTRGIAALVADRAA